MPTTQFTFTAINPATLEPLEPTYHEATIAEIDEAVRQAEAAFEIYRKTTGKARAAFLRAVATEIDNLGDALVERATAETALPAARIIGERARTTGQLKMFASLIEEGSWVDARIDHADPKRTPLPKPDLRRMLIPLGPVTVFGASNFPLAFSTAGGDTASALAAGCSVVVKGHPSHPGTSELVAGAIQKAIASTKMPAGVFSLLQGRSPEMSLALVRHPMITAVGFTGSLRAGRAIFDAAAARPHPIPVYAEMGSVNPVFILPGAMKMRGAAIAEGLKNSVTLGVGQFCTNPGVVVAAGGDSTNAFITELANHISKCATGTMLNENIGRTFASGVKKLSGTSGVTGVAKSEAAASLASHATAAVFATTAERFAADASLREELFGPATLIVTGKSPDDLRLAATALEGQLTATIIADDSELPEYQWLVDLLQRKVGRLIINGYPTGVEVCPSIHHGGPYPATTDSRSTSVGTAAIERFARPICYQDFPQNLLPPELQDANPLRIWRLVDNQFMKA